MAYKIASQNEQQRLLRNALIVNYGIDNGDETKAEKRITFLKIIAQIENELKHEKNKDKRKNLGLRKLEIQNQLAGLREYQKSRDLSNFIADVVKEQVTKAHWTGIVKEASRRFEEHLSKSPDSIDKSLG